MSEEEKTYKAEFTTDELATVVLALNQLSGQLSSMVADANAEGDREWIATYMSVWDMSAHLSEWLGASLPPEHVRETLNHG